MYVCLHVIDYVYTGDFISAQHYIFDTFLGFIVHNNEMITELQLPVNLW